LAHGQGLGELYLNQRIAGPPGEIGYRHVSDRQAARGDRYCGKPTELGDSRTVAARVYVVPKQRWE